MPCPRERYRCLFQGCRQFARLSRTVKIFTPTLKSLLSEAFFGPEREISV